MRTAHNGLRSFDWDVNKKVFFPFHFVPPKPLNGEPFSYITEPGSVFAQNLLDDAIRDQSELRLYRIGVALHTYADTWAHQRFSGRKHNENDAEKLCTYENNECIGRKKFLDFIFDLFRARIGHLQAHRYPDYSYERWGYEDYREEFHERSNSGEFLKSAYAILTKLAHTNNINDVDSIWYVHKDKIKTLFEIPLNKEKDQLDKRCEKWLSEYIQFFESDNRSNKYDYQKNEWRDIAMKFADQGNLKAFLKTDWVKFQKAALKQRYYVLERLM